MKIAAGLLVSVFAVFVPSRASALERDLRNVVLFELHAGASLPAPVHTSEGRRSDTDWSEVGPNAGLSIGYGLTRSIAARLHVDAFFFRLDSYTNAHLYDVGADLLTCFGNADTLLWRPFVGLGYGNTGASYFTTRVGVEALIPLSETPDAAGFLMQALVETAFYSDGYYATRIGPMAAIRLGINFDVL